MHHNIDVSIIIFVGFDEMIPSTKRTDAFICAVYIDHLCTAQFRQVDATCISMSFCANLETGRNSCTNNFVQLLRFNMRFFDTDSFHAASNVNADKVRANLILDGHRGSDCTTSPSMNVWHHTDFASLDVRLIQKIDNLRDRLIIDHVGKHLCSAKLTL